MNWEQYNKSNDSIITTIIILIQARLVTIEINPLRSLARRFLRNA